MGTGEIRTGGKVTIDYTTMCPKPEHFPDYLEVEVLECSHSFVKVKDDEGYIWNVLKDHLKQDEPA